MLENNVEREKEMERLRTELVDATKIVRELFDATAKSDKKADPSTAQIQCEITSLNEVHLIILFQISFGVIKNMKKFIFPLKRII